MVRKTEEALGGWVTWLEYWLYVIQSVALIMDFSLQMQRFNESLMATLLYLLNNPESRLYVRSDVGLEVLKVYQLCMIIQFIYLIFFRLFDFFIISQDHTFLLQSVLAPFTDLHYRHNPDTPETHLR